MNFVPDAAAARIFEDVLANFAFLFGESRPAAELPRLEGAGWLACLPFRAPETGSIVLAVPEGLAIEIAANSMGVDAADPEVPFRAPDALKEVVSVMGGHLAGALEGSGAAVTLFPPRIFPLRFEEWDRLRSDPETRCFTVRELPVLLRLGSGPGVPA
jgi:hypothetical protein